MNFYNIFIFIVCFEFGYCSYLKPCNERKLKNNTENAEIGPPIYYYDVETVLDLLQKPKNKQIPEIQKLLEYYYAAKETKAHFDASGGIIRHPLIVLEGLSGSGKTTIAGVLLKKLNGTQYHTPPRPIQNLKIRRPLRDDMVLDTAYHALSNYISSLEVSQLLGDSPVIMDRYWYSTAAFAIALAVNNYPEKYTYPPKGNKIYDWPKGLVKPDMVLFLDVDENIRQQRVWGRNQIGLNNVQNPRIQAIGQKYSRPEGLGYFMDKCPEYRMNLIQAYKNMENPQVTVINGDPPIPQVLEEIYSKIKPIFPTVNFN